MRPGRAAAVRVLLAGLVFAFAPASAQPRAPEARAPITCLVAPPVRAAGVAVRPASWARPAPAPRLASRRGVPLRRMAQPRTWPRVRWKSWLWSHALLR